MTTLAEAIDAINFDLGDAANPIPDPIHQSSNVEAARVVTYQFENSQPGDLWYTYSGWQAMSAQEQQFYTLTLAYVETLINIDFQEVTGQSDPDMNVGTVTLPGGIVGEGGFNYFYSIPFGAPAYITEYDQFTVFDVTNLVGNTSLVLHELGHALGLKHPFQGTPTLPASLDSNKYTVMSYTDNPDNGLETDGYLAYDIAALQQRWGANMNTATGDDIYTGPRNNTVDAIWDAGGLDTFDASAIATGVVLNLNEGEFSRFGAYDDVTIAYGVVIENATGGAGNDVITGNSSANILDGGSGIDTLNGGDGDDMIITGLGADVVDGGAGNDWVDYTNSTNTQVINLITNVNTGGYAHNDTLTSIENIIGSTTHGDNITGTSGDNILMGLGADDRLRGHHGNDTLVGGDNNDYLYGGSGADILSGGNGLDWAMYNGLTVGVNVNLGGGTGSGGQAAGDTYTSIERVRGSLADDVITGNQFSNKILGDGGNDIIFGMGGKDSLRGGNGDDRIDGGSGNDSLFGDAGSDTLVYGVGSGHDFIVGFEDGIDKIELDSALWGNGLNATEVVDTYMHMENDTRFHFDFGGGSVLHVISSNALTLADFYDDLTIV